MTHLNDAKEAMDLIWDTLGDYRENYIPEGDSNYDSQWDDICEAMECLRVECDLPEWITPTKDGQRLRFDGWHQHGLGGGLLGLICDSFNGWYFLLTEEDANLPVHGETILFGAYHDEFACEGVCVEIPWTTEEEVRLKIRRLEVQWHNLAKHTKGAINDLES